jgi:hypothetical protein
VKPDQPSTSTTDTLLQWKPAGSQAALTVSVVAVSLSAHAFLHVSVLAATVVAVALLLRYQELVARQALPAALAEDFLAVLRGPAAPGQRLTQGRWVQE